MRQTTNRLRRDALAVESFAKEGPRRRARKLRVDELAVDSFPTDAPARVEPGTVHGHACTDGNTCRCPTSYAQCGTGPATIYSCQRTAFDCA